MAARPADEVAPAHGRHSGFRRDPAAANTEAVEDYAKAIYALARRSERGPVATSALAERLGVSPGLGDGDAEADGRAGPGRARALPRASTLTPAGREGRARGDPPPPPARGLPRRGSRDALGPGARRGRGARALHLRGARGADRRRSSAIPTLDPHGDPIPDRRSSTWLPSRTTGLAELEPGQAATLRARLGLRPRDAPLPGRARHPAGGPADGSRGAQPFGGPLFVEVDGREHVLGGELAEKMRVEVWPNVTGTERAKS